MAYMTTDHAAAARTSGFGAFFSRIGRALDTYAQSSRRMRDFERLNAKSDAQLAEMGLTRDKIAHHVFRDLFYL